MTARTLLLATALAMAPLSAQTRQLFNGKTLSGWQFLPNQPEKDGFEVHDGAIETTTGTGMLWFTREKIGNATIRVVYKMSNERGNSGIFIRMPEKPESEGDGINKGIEVQIDNRDDDWHCTGVLYSMTRAMARPYKPVGEWNTMEITLDGVRTIVKLNGVLITDYDGVSPVPAKAKPFEPERGPRPAEGYIGIQHHDDLSVISFREISVTPLAK
jgi:3-keto-disaccharide hydrolase